jgi:hypothetical protein
MGSEVGERALAVQVGDDPGHLASADVEQNRRPRRHLGNLKSARLATPAPVHEHEDTLAVELTVLVHFVVEILPGAQHVAPAFCHARQSPRAAR